MGYWIHAGLELSASAPPPGARRDQGVLQEAVRTHASALCTDPRRAAIQERETAAWARSRSSVLPEAVRQHASAHSTDPRRAQGSITKTIVKEQRPARAA
jgi:hypothetical protein